MNQFLKRIHHSGFILPSALLGYLWLKGYQPGIPGFTCLMRQATGIPCPTCYLTRATCSALTGNLSESIQYHLLGPLAATSLIAWAWLSLKQKRLIPQGVTKLPIKTTTIALITYWSIRIFNTYWLPETSYLDFPD